MELEIVFADKTFFQRHATPQETSGHVEMFALFMLSTK